MNEKQNSVLPCSDKSVQFMEKMRMFFTPTFPSHLYFISDLFQNIPPHPTISFPLLLHFYFRFAPSLLTKKPPFTHIFIVTLNTFVLFRAIEVSKLYLKTFLDLFPSNPADNNSRFLCCLCRWDLVFTDN